MTIAVFLFQGNPEILAIGNQLRELFDSEFKKAFNIQDQ